MMGVKVRYADIALNGKSKFRATSDDKQPFVNMELFQGSTYLYDDYINPCELYNMTLNNNEKPFIKQDLLNVSLSYWTTQQSNIDNIFADVPTIEFASFDSSVLTAQGISFTFDTVNNVLCTELTCKWYRNNSLLSEKTFYPNSVTYFCENLVENFDKLIVTFTKLNMPFSYLKINGIEWGTVREFLGDELSNTVLNQEIHQLSEEISINTFNFTLRSKTDVEYIFQKKQSIEIVFNDVLRGVHFIDTAERTPPRVWQVTTVDYIGLLDKISFNGGMYINETAFNIINDIMTKALIPFKLSDDLHDVEISGFIPITTCREALMQVAFSIGAVVDTSNSNVVEIYKLQDTIKTTFTELETFIGKSFDEDDAITGVELISHSYLKTNEIINVFEAVEDGVGNNIRVKFTEPLHDLNIVNGTIINSNANYALINASDNCVLSGKKYTHSKRVYSKDNPLVSELDLQNIYTIENATLINKNNVYNILDLVYNYYIRHIRTNAKLLLENNETVGAKIVIENADLENTVGYIETMNYNLNGGRVIAEVTVK